MANPQPVRADPPLLLPSGDELAVLPLEPQVRLYVCGITPYEATHLGHAFTFVVYDVLVRFLRSRGHRVSYCQNVTDVDDDILRQARRVGEDAADLALRETKDYLEDMAALGVPRPDCFPRASAEIDTMIELAQDLQNAGSVYVSQGMVYFDVTTFPGFGDGRSEAEQRELLAQRGGDPEDARKRSPLDFVVWQPSQAGEPSWESPWGHGRPGWHLECSAMARRHLGNTLDIHGGGEDLAYPHHASERAQSETVTGAPLARYWLRTAMVRHEGEKMSKSLGNLVFVRELLAAGHEPAAIRLMLLAYRYDHSWEFDAAQLTVAADRLARWREAAEGRAGARGTGARVAEVEEALGRNLDTPAALVLMDELVRQGRGAEVRAGADLLGVDLPRRPQRSAR